MRETAAARRLVVSVVVLSALFLIAAAAAGCAHGGAASRAANAAPARIDSTAFLDWWERTIGTPAHAAPPAGVRREARALTRLRRCDACARALRPMQKGVRYRGYWLHRSDLLFLSLIVPLDSAASTSWLTVSPGNGTTPLDLDPFGRDDYGPADVTLTLFWLAGLDQPYLEIRTPGRACSPAVLLGYDVASGSYAETRRECSTGASGS